MCAVVFTSFVFLLWRSIFLSVSVRAVCLFLICVPSLCCLLFLCVPLCAVCRFSFCCPVILPPTTLPHSSLSLPAYTASAPLLRRATKDTSPPIPLPPPVPENCCVMSANLPERSATTSNSSRTCDFQRIPIIFNKLKLCFYLLTTLVPTCL